MTALPPLERLSPELPELLERLRRAGYGVGVDTHIRVHHVLAALAAEGNAPRTAGELERSIGPIVCSGPREQAELHRHLREWLAGLPLELRWSSEAARLAEAEPTAVPIGPLAEAARRAARVRAAVLVLVAVAMVAALGVAGVRHWRSRRAQAPTQVATTTNAPTGTVGSPKPDGSTTEGSTPTTPSVEPRPTAPTDFSWLPPRGPTREEVVKLDQRRRRRALIPFAPWVVLVVSVLWSIVYRLRTRFLLSRLPAHADVDLSRLRLNGVTERLLATPRIRRALQALRRHRLERSVELDPVATIAATVAAGGWFTPVTGHRPSRPEFLVLVNRESRHDHQASAADELVREMRREGVSLVGYDYAGSPHRGVRSPGGRWQPLTNLSGQALGNDLVILGDAVPLLDPVAGGPRAELAPLLTSPRPALMTPKPWLGWGRAERTLADTGIPVLPLSVGGLEWLADRATSSSADPDEWTPAAESDEEAWLPGPFPPLLRGDLHGWLGAEEPSDARELTGQLARYLGSDGFRWLAACAVFPGLYWGITTYLGQELRSRAGAPLLSLSRVEALATLPWFRTGAMPSWLRWRLVRTLSRADRRATGTALFALLKRTVDRGDEGFDLDVAASPAPTRPERRTLLGWLRRAPPESPLSDHLFVTVLRGRRPSRLGLVLPRRLGRALAPRPRPSAGSRIGRFVSGLARAAVRLVVGTFTSSVRIAAACAASIVLAILFPPRLEVTLRGHHGSVSSASFSADGTKVVTAGEDGTARIWDSKTGEELGRLSGHHGGVLQATFSAHDERILTLGRDGSARVWSASDHRELWSTEERSPRVTQAAFCDLDPAVLSAQIEKAKATVEERRAALQAEVLGRGGTGRPGRGVAAASLEREVQRLEASIPTLPPPDELRRIILAESGGGLEIRLAVDGRTVASFTGTAPGWIALGCSTDGSRAVAVSSLGDVAQLDVLSGTRVNTKPPLRHHKPGTITTAAIGPGADRVAILRDGEVSLGTPDGTDLLPGPPGIAALAFTPDGEQLRAVTAYGDLAAWSVASHHLVFERPSDLNAWYPAVGSVFDAGFDAERSKLAFRPWPLRTPWVSGFLDSKAPDVVSEVLPVNARTPKSWEILQLIAQAVIARTLVPTDWAVAPGPMAFDRTGARLVDAGGVISSPAIWEWTGRPDEAPWSATGRPLDDMVEIPAGPFFMGCNEKVDEECDDDEKPGKTVVLPTFQVDRTDVTVAQYASCVRAGACDTKGVTVPYYDGRDQPEFAGYCNWGASGRTDHPMNCVDWRQATAYCAWLGKRLPSEEEWEKAARGTDGRKYPWGNEGYGKAGLVANIADESAKIRFPAADVTESYDDGYVGTSPVGAFPAGASPYGALDLVGNVWQWTSSNYDANRRVLRGGSWNFQPSLARASFRVRTDPDARDVNVGFRCAQ